MEINYNLLGAMASILALSITLYRLVKSSIDKINKEEAELEKQYELIYKDSKILFDQASTHQKRLEVSLYLNGLLNMGRHFEIRGRFTGLILLFPLAIVIMINVFLWVSILLSDKQIDAYTYVSSLISSLGTVCLIILTRKFFKRISKVAKTNDSYADGYIDSFDEYIDKKFPS